MLKSARHAKILEIISQKEIETQEELCAELIKQNYVVAQATISRDIKDLNLFKVSGVEKKYRYAHIRESVGSVSPKMKSLFTDCVLNIQAAQNIVVIKTLPGNGNNAGMVIDRKCNHIFYRRIKRSFGGNRRREVGYFGFRQLCAWGES